jgi:putative endonuclease
VKYYVYIATNQHNNVLYAGITNNLVRRIYEHREKLVEGFTKKYNVTKLVYYEEFTDPLIAIEREKQLKAGSRKKKLDLIIKKNPMYEDLYYKII